MKRLTGHSPPSRTGAGYPAALVLLGDPQSTRRAIAWVIGHLGPGQKPLVWVAAQRFLRQDAELEAFSKCAAVRTPAAQVAWRGGPVLALWPAGRDLVELAADRRVTALCVLGRRGDQKDNAAWLAAARGSVLTAVGGPPAAPRELPPVVVEALRTLATLVEPGHQLSGSMDDHHAVVTLSTLRHGGYRLDPDGICAWALANAWPRRGANRLAELATRIQAGAAVRAPGFDSYPRPELLRLWREGATQSL